FDLHGAVGNLRPVLALHGVAPAHAIHVRVAAVGDHGVGVGRGDHDHAHFLVDLGGGDGHAGVQVPDHRHDVLVRDDVLRVGHAHVGLGLIVERPELPFVAH